MGKGGQKSESSKQAPTRKTKAAVDHRQNNKMLRQCPPSIAQQIQYHAIAVPTVVQNRVTKTMSIAPPLEKFYGALWKLEYCLVAAASCTKLSR